ncbi:WD repeat-containing protein 43 isoform X1 [Hydra vulgaris]|uniref:WD repeat-containing protein 43 isoform X1 n=1 Tax=Hydra vulgaris TaxID=6087 RepID=UPI001F5E9747|nr:WD repeat-containing protein 43 isoform X1 [Hydra vulgaris]
MEAYRRDCRASSFTHNNLYFALLSIDGRLRIWDVLSGKILQEFSSASTVESSCTCLCWTRNRDPKEKKKKDSKAKRKKLEEINNHDVPEYPSLVVGTKNGTLFIYNPNIGEISTVFKEHHTDQVNCVSYFEGADLSYTCSDDGFIMEWSNRSGKATSKWKAGKLPIHIVCVDPKGEVLLSASNSIKLWSINTKELLMEFNGHSSSVSLLQFSAFCSVQNDPVISSDGYYFLSGSTNDRVVNAWHINCSKPNKEAIASYRLSDFPIFLDTMVVEDDDQPLKVCVGCQDGRVHFFENALNGKAIRPIEAKKTLDLIHKEGGNKSCATPVALLNGGFEYSTEFSLRIVFGGTVNPSFQNYIYSSLEDCSKVIVDFSKNILLKQRKKAEENVIDYPVTNKSTKYLGQLHVNLKKKTDIVIDVNGNEEDRQKTDTEQDMRSMEERMKNVTPDIHYDKSNIPSAGSFSQMLIQAIHSSDEVLLNEILFKTFPDTVLRNTIRRVPVKLIGPLIINIVDKLQQNPNRSKILVSWLRVIMGVHLTHVMTNESISTALATLYNLLKVQQEVHPLLLNIQGKIDLLISHAVNKRSLVEEIEDVNDNPIVFNDDSDDEAETLVDKLLESDPEGDAGESVQNEDEESSDNNDSGSEDSDENGSESDQY